MADNVEKRPISVRNHLWWYGLVVLALSAVVGYLTYARATELVPHVVSTYKGEVFANWRVNLPLIVSLALTLLAAGLGAVLAIYCFFYGLRCFVPPAVPSFAPKDFRNQPQVPDLLRKGEIRTYYIPRSRILKLMVRILPNVRYLTKETKRLIISNIAFVLRWLIAGAALIVLYRYRMEILSQLSGLGLRTEDIVIPSVAPVVWIIAAVMCARLAGVGTLMSFGPPKAETLVGGVNCEFEGHPNTVYSAVQSAAECIRNGDFQNRVHIEQSKLVDRDTPDEGTFSGSMLVESYPRYFSAAHVLSAAIELAAGAALTAYAFWFYYGLGYSTDAVSVSAFLKRDMPFYLRDIIVFTACLGWGKTLFLQAIRLLCHYRFSSRMVHAEFAGRYGRTVPAGPAPARDGARKLKCSVEIILRATTARSECYQLWGERELISFEPTGKTGSVLAEIERATLQELVRSES